MYANTQAITVAGDVISLERKGVSNAEILGRFNTDDGKYVMEIRQKGTKGRKRHEAVLTFRKIAADPLTAVNSEVSFSIGLYVDQPRFGFTYEAELSPIYSAFVNWMNSGAVFADLVSGDT